MKQGMNSMILDILDLTGLTHSQVVSIYPYGSRVYGTHRPSSDWDYIVVADDCEEKEYRSGDINAHTYSAQSFQQSLNLHHVSALECLFLPRDQVLMDRGSWTFALDTGMLRREFSAKTSNSWVKCRKKLTVEENQQWIGVKSLFHAMRIAEFGIQIAEDGGIQDYARSLSLWEEISHMASEMEAEGLWDWAPFNTRYKPVYNGLMTRFRKLAAKD